MGEPATSDQRQRHAVFGFLREFVRSTAQARLMNSTKFKEIEIEEIADTEDFTYDHWIAAIVISAAVIRVKFSVHFTTKSARAFVQKNPVLAPVEDPNVCHDFIREYCNLTAGAIKQGLEKVNSNNLVNEGYIVNLPHEQPAFDKIDRLDKGVGNNKVRDCWKFKALEHELICATMIEVVDWDSIDSIAKLDISSLLVSDDGSVEFL